MASRLTEAQRHYLTKMARVFGISVESRGAKIVCNKLCRSGLAAEYLGDPVIYYITPAGRAALEKRDE